ncbi:MAG TPA: beta-propeller domain-containing protein [Allosphingosinicella sp.]|nr:beta-propeller domain-containing protein [Allosphingosinicella sp.]
MGLGRTIMVAAILAGLAGDALAQRIQRRPVTEAERRAAEVALDRFTATTLTRFAGDAEFRRYAAAVRQYERTRDEYYYTAGPGAGIRFAQAEAATQSDSPQTLCVPTPEQPCADEERILITGSRVAPPRNPSITNNQERNVEEGDIVKQIDHYLLTLQDGRIFVTDIDAGGAGRLELTDRIDVYRDARSDMWYDEMLVFGDRVMITGYSYDERATELAVFRLSEAGRLAREGVFRISSNDYYSTSGYATRLIDGNLVTYTPLRLETVVEADFKWPVVRRWLAEDDAREAAWRATRARNWRARREAMPQAGPPLLDAASIYRPVRRLEDPVIHTVSVCPLASADEGRGLACRTTAVVGPEEFEYYVTTDSVYLWTADAGHRYGSACGADIPLRAGEGEPALVYRMPVSGARPGLIAAHGMPPDQFAMQADGRILHALVRLVPRGCRQSYDAPSRLGFYRIPLARLGDSLSQASAAMFTDLPGVESYSVASRFTDTYLVYGGLSGYRRYPDLAEYADDPEYRRRVLRRLRPQPAYAVPIARPDAVRAIDIGHNVIRAERVANDIVLTGYRNARGLSVTLIDLAARPRVGSTVLLAGRYESEGRSHAFNSLAAADGSALMGLPTVSSAVDSRRDHWRSRASDLSFLAMDSTRRLRGIGELERRFDYVDGDDDGTGRDDEDGVPGYSCEVSCIDWYGNSRPIFTDGRIFGLSGTELIEGRIERGRIREVQRLNIALESERRR